MDDIQNTLSALARLQPAVNEANAEFKLLDKAVLQVTGTKVDSKFHLEIRGKQLFISYEAVGTL